MPYRNVGSFSTWPPAPGPHSGFQALGKAVAFPLGEGADGMETGRLENALGAAGCDVILVDRLRPQESRKSAARRRLDHDGAPPRTQDTIPLAQNTGTSPLFRRREETAHRVYDDQIEAGVLERQRVERRHLHVEEYARAFGGAFRAGSRGFAVDDERGRAAEPHLRRQGGRKPGIIETDLQHALTHAGGSHREGKRREPWLANAKKHAIFLMI